MKSVTDLIIVAEDFVSKYEQKLTIIFVKFQRIVIILRNEFLHHKTLKHIVLLQNFQLL